ncbi:hypothetical protein MXMO3_03601 (plasmid) [Maritalea myrionectae]|uniref:DUF1127 domain-containing protein n=2 Tax=Maritalea myrionectae TaxID=454601 RepID=A0A2R4MJG8_9HYPH|nr:hypothetical protein MXMO3_03601 [Maritalea myrionectae]
MCVRGSSELEDGMSITEQKPNATPLLSAQRKPITLLREWLSSIMRKWRRRKMIAMYETLDDHILWDIGLSRGEIKDMVNNLDAQKLREKSSSQMLPNKRAPERNS